MAVTARGRCLSRFLACEQSTQDFAAGMAGHLTFPVVCYFKGEIGSGKTSFIRALLQALGVAGAIKSPSYSIVESYSLTDGMAHHFDLYRIHDEEELEDLGWRDYFEMSDTIVCLEWPERASNVLPIPDLMLELVQEGAGRRLVCTAHSAPGSALLIRLSEEGDE